MAKPPQLAAQPDVNRRLVWLWLVLRWSAIMLGVRGLLVILSVYVRYFPPDFESDFLIGREQTFVGLYRAAFYVHIVVGPIAMIGGFFLLCSGPRRRFKQLHRTIGKLQIAIVVFLLCPSGLVMATQSFGGWRAGLGFAALSIATAGTAILAAIYARQRKFAVHRRWATRCFVLLCSPLLLRLMTGATIVTKVDSLTTYQLTAWISWLPHWRLTKSSGNDLCNSD